MTFVVNPESAIRFRVSYTLDPSDTGTMRIFIAGELDIRTADGARSAIERAQSQARDLTCDLAGVTSIDVPGVCVLIDLAARAQQHGGSLSVVNPPPIVARILRVFGLAAGVELPAPPIDGATPTRAQVCNVTVRPRGGQRTARRRRRRT